MELFGEVKNVLNGFLTQLGQILVGFSVLDTGFGMTFAGIVLYKLRLTHALLVVEDPFFQVLLLFNVLHITIYHKLRCLSDSLEGRRILVDLIAYMGGTHEQQAYGAERKGYAFLGQPLQSNRFLTLIPFQDECFPVVEESFHGVYESFVVELRFEIGDIGLQVLHRLFDTFRFALHDHLVAQLHSDLINSKL